LTNLIAFSLVAFVIILGRRITRGVHA
jgi:hypothetical protein